MNCDECRALLVGGDESDGVDAHLSECGECSDLAPGLRSRAAWLGRKELWAEPGPGLRNRFLSEFEDAAPVTGRRWRLVWALGGVAAMLTAMLAFASLTGRPDWEVTMAGTEDAPLASAVVAGWNEGESTRVRLDIDGLSDAPRGSLYELWFSGDDGLISAGTFTGADDEIELTVGVRRSAFPRIWVTLEPIDAEPAPSGLTVLSTPRS